MILIVMAVTWCVTWCVTCVVFIGLLKPSKCIG